MKKKLIRSFSRFNCVAKIRPSYCFETKPTCCLTCAYNSKCMAIAKEKKMIRPCTLEIFEEEELCEFGV